MGLLWNLLARPVISVQDSEKVHSRTMFSLKSAQRIPPLRWVLKLFFRAKDVPCSIFEWDLKNPLGLAAGMDKKAENIMAWENLGFGFVEVGGFTAKPQDGNEKPRMFRNSAHGALINRMGFNNPGSKVAAETLAAVQAKRKNPAMKILANLGRSKSTPNTDAADDYCTSLERLWKFVDGFVINVSSPNTQGLRELQEGDALKSLLESCISKEKECGGGKPVLVKIAPDLSDEQLDLIIDIARDSGCAGIVATNTTLERPQQLNKRSAAFISQTGGLSGSPLKHRSTEVIKHIYNRTDGKWPIIGVGGISTADDAWEKITNGACSIQIYSSLVFKGPGVIKEIVNGLTRKLKENDLQTLDEAIGLALKGD